MISMFIINVNLSVNNFLILSVWRAFVEVNSCEFGVVSDIRDSQNIENHKIIIQIDVNPPTELWKLFVAEINYKKFETRN